MKYSAKARRKNYFGAFPIVLSFVLGVIALEFLT
jgi:hypothetical protein